MFCQCGRRIVTFSCLLGTYDMKTIFRASLDRRDAESRKIQ